MVRLNSRGLVYLALAGWWVCAGVAWSAPRTTPASPRDQAPVLRLSYQPLYPREFLLKGNPGQAVVVFTVNRFGRVEAARAESASHDAFGRAALEAVRHWEYQPALRGGEAVPARVRQKFAFRPTVDSFFTAEFHDLARKPVPVLPLVGPRPQYPESLRGKNLRGFADVLLTVNAAGKVTQTRLLDFNHKDFGQPALDAAGGWEFKPFDPARRHEEETGTRPVFLGPQTGSYQVKLTLVFDPRSSGRPPLDLRKLGEH